MDVADFPRTHFQYQQRYKKIQQLQLSGQYLRIVSYFPPLLIYDEHVFIASITRVAQRLNLIANLNSEHWKKPILKPINCLVPFSLELHVGIRHRAESAVKIHIQHTCVTYISSVSIRSFKLTHYTYIGWCKKNGRTYNQSLPSSGLCSNMKLHTS